MRKTANLCVRIEPEIKKQAEKILEELGIPVSTAINIFYKQVILRGGMPFEVNIPKEEPNYIKIPEEELKNLFVGYAPYIPNDDTVAALRELKEMRTNKDKYKRYSSIKEILDEL